MERATAPWLASWIVADVVSRAALGKMITRAPQFRDPDQHGGTAAPALRRRAITATGRRGACPTLDVQRRSLSQRGEPSLTTARWIAALRRTADLFRNQRK